MAISSNSSTRYVQSDKHLNYKLVHYSSFHCRHGQRFHGMAMQFIFHYYFLWPTLALSAFRIPSNFHSPSSPFHPSYRPLKQVQHKSSLVNIGRIFRRNHIIFCQTMAMASAWVDTAKKNSRCTTI